MLILLVKRRYIKCVLSNIGPHRLIQLLQHRIQLRPQYLVHLLRPTIIRKAVVHKLPVNNDFVHQLFGQPFQPFALVVGPAVLGKNAVHGFGYALFKRDQRFTQSGAADIADDAGGYVFIGLVAHGALQASLGVAVVVQQQFYFP